MMSCCSSVFVLLRNLAGALLRLGDDMKAADAIKPLRALRTQPGRSIIPLSSGIAECVY